MMRTKLGEPLRVDSLQTRVKERCAVDDISILDLGSDTPVGWWVQGIDGVQGNLMVSRFTVWKKNRSHVSIHLVRDAKNVAAHAPTRTRIAVHGIPFAIL